MKICRYVCLTIALAGCGTGEQRYLGRTAPEWVEATVRSKNESARVESIRLLGQNGKEAADFFLHRLRSAERDQYTEYALSLETAQVLGCAGPGAVPGLIDALKDEDAYVRWAAALALRRIGPEAKAAVPELTRISQEDKAVVVDRAGPNQRRPDIYLPVAETAARALLEIDRPSSRP